MHYIFFFFSSRRRHTRYWRDWSSDVCSSDLKTQHGMIEQVERIHAELSIKLLGDLEILHHRHVRSERPRAVNRVKIGRASCRERVYIWEDEITLKKKKYIKNKRYYRTLMKKN